MPPTILASARARENSTCGRRRCGIGAGGGGRRLPPNPCRSGSRMRRARAHLRHTPEQICTVIAMTCEKPSESERPISHWSQREIADEAIRRGLVSNISQRSVGRFLKKRPTHCCPNIVHVVSHN